MKFFSLFILLIITGTACVSRQYNASENSIPRFSLRSGIYMNPAGAGTKVEIGPIAGSGPELKVLGLRQTAPIVLQSTDGMNWKFSGKGCVITLSVNSAERFYINQVGPCEYYGFVGNGPDRRDLDLTGPYFAPASQRFTLKSGRYQNPAGAGTRIEIGPIAGAGPELKVVGLRQTAPIVLQSTDGMNWKFNGQGCVITLTVNDDDKLYINQSGTCEPYGFVANGPDRQNLDLTGPYFAN